MAITEAMKEKLVEKMSLRGPRSLDTEAIAKAYLSGQTVVEIATEFGCTIVTVYRHLRKARDE